MMTPEELADLRRLQWLFAQWPPTDEALAEIRVLEPRVQAAHERACREGLRSYYFPTAEELEQRRERGITAAEAERHGIAKAATVRQWASRGLLYPVGFAGGGTMKSARKLYSLAKVLELADRATGRGAEDVSH